MNTFIVINLGYTIFFTIGIGIYIFIAHRRGRLTPLTKKEMLCNSAMRIGYGTLPYLALAYTWQYLRGDPSLLCGFPFWFAVIGMPLGGHAVDLWRLQDVKSNDRNA